MLHGKHGEIIIMKFFDYSYYRFSDFYKKKRDSSSEMTGAIILATLQSFVIIDLLLVVEIFLEYSILNKISKLWFLLLYFNVVLLNWIKYVKPRKYRVYRKQWEDEPTYKRRRNGVALILCLIISIIIPILYGFIKYNLIEGKSFLG